MLSLHGEKEEEKVRSLTVWMYDSQKMTPSCSNGRLPPSFLFWQIGDGRHVGQLGLTSRGRDNARRPVRGGVGLGEWGGQKGGGEWREGANSKHWFTTSLLTWWEVPESDARSVSKMLCGLCLCESEKNKMRTPSTPFQKVNFLHIVCTWNNCIVPKG